MPSTSEPFGFQAVRTVDGAKQPQYQIFDGGIPSAYGTAIYFGQPVKLVTGGTIQPAAVSDRLLGVFAGVEYVDAEGRVRVSEHWTASTTLLAGTSTKVRVYVDPNIIYRVQTDATMAQTAIGDQADSVNPTNNSQGYSTAQLDATLVGAGNNAQFRVIGLSSEEGNDWGDTYVNVLVQISEHAYVADAAAI